MTSHFVSLWDFVTAINRDYNGINYNYVWRHLKMNPETTTRNRVEIHKTSKAYVLG